MGTQLKKLTMYNKVKELSREGLSIRQISRTTGLDRVTVRKYLQMSEEDFSDFLALQKQRLRKLQPYEQFIKERVTDYPDCSAAQVEDWLKEHHPDFQEVTTRTIYSFVQWIRKSHHISKPKGTPRQYHPVTQLPYGQQAQVDFGEYWMVNADEDKVKVYFMIMLLSRSRRKFVSFSQQPITTRFVLEAHEQAFTFFEGIPHTLVYDQDSTIVTNENRGAILYTEAFNKYLLHRSLKIHLCRKSDPESKGKIEAGVKYVKHNFRLTNLEVDFFSDSLMAAKIRSRSLPYLAAWALLTLRISSTIGSSFID
jgi:transposase